MAAKAKAKATAKKTGKLTKAGLITAIADQLGEESSRKQVKAIIEKLAEIGSKELKKNDEFTIPGFAKFQIRTRKSRPAREGINPATGEKIQIKAKPASKVIRARPIKALKDIVLK